MNKKALKAFTILELGIVTLVIGLLVYGITKGIGIVSTSRISSARFLTNNSGIGGMDGLVAWYETSSYDSFLPAQYVNNGQISEWRDISPLSLPQQKNKLTRSASSSVVLLMNGINKIPTVSFSGPAGLTLTNFYQGSLSQSTIFVVVNPQMTMGAGTVVLTDSYSSGSTYYTAIKSNRVTLNAGTTANTAIVTNVPSISFNNNYIVAAYFDNTSSRAYVNDAATTAGAGNISPGTNLMTGLTVGSDKTVGTTFTGYISEVIIFNKVLDINKRKDVMGYLSKKYKIPVTGL